MLGEIGCHGHFAAIQRRVAEAVDALISVDLERDEISAGRRDQYFGIRNFHRASSTCIRNFTHSLRFSRPHSPTASAENFKFAGRAPDPSPWYCAQAEARESSRRTESGPR